MTRHTWPKTLASVGLTVIALAVAVYATAVATAGVTAGLMGDRLGGEDLLSWGSATIVAAVATAAVFGYLAVTSARDLMRRR